jgi:outer membrane receptor protein involved in Fe transport
MKRLLVLRTVHWLRDSCKRFLPYGVLLAAVLGAPADGWAQIEEIVVTTRRREESLQDVPIAVTALGAEQIERQNINSLTDIVQLAPSVQFDNAFGPSDTRITIRGLSNTRGRSNVAFLIDGIDVTTENVISAGSGLLANRRLLNDVQRIELVKGPQSALYGRAAFSGAISYVTKEPGPQPEGKVGVDFAEDGQRQIDFSYATPVRGLEDLLAVRVSGVWWDEDGRYKNLVSGTEVGGTDGFGGAFTSVFTPTDTIKIKARLEYTDEDYQLRPAVRIGGSLPVELLATEDASQDNTWQYTIIEPGQPGNENGTEPIRISTDADNDGLPDLNPGATYTCREQGNVFRRYPKSALDADLGVGTIFGFQSTGLADFGPGYCLPESLGSADGRAIKFSEDAFTGQDYTGTEQETFRASIVATLDSEFGSFSFYTGWTDFNGIENYDQDYQAQGRPDTLLGQQQTRQTTDTDQFSQELRFTSNFPGQLQATLGVLYWEEQRRLLDQNFIVSCSPVTKVSRGDPGLSTLANAKYGVPRSGDSERRVCNGQNGTVASWQEYARLLPLSGFNSSTGVADPYFNATTWDADTESWSAYLMLQWSFAERWQLTFETRYLNEDFTLLRPAKTSCTTAAFSPGPGNAWRDESNLAADPSRNDVVCEAEAVLNDNIVTLPPGVAGAPDWKYIEGTQSSTFSTPKVTLEWFPADDVLVYFFWAQGQKPGGINQLAGSGTASEVVENRFDSEKLEAWEFGTKSAWEFGGLLQANAAFFFQDYTDKQLSTQILVDGQQQARVLNASGAEVWGFEVETTWQPWFSEGLTLAAAYTFLDAEYTSFELETAALLRAAQLGRCDVVTKLAGTPGEFKTCSFDLSGNNLERTPENALVLQANYTRQFPNLDFDWFVDVNASWEDERSLDENDFTKFDDYWLVDARLGLSAEQWEVIAYVDNVFDDDTIRTGGTGPDFGSQVVETGFTAGFGALYTFGILPEPRTVGLRANYRF